MALNDDVENLNETAQADDTNPQSGFPSFDLVEFEYWLLKAITPLQQLLKIGIDLDDFSYVDEGNRRTIEFKGDLLKEIAKAEQLLHWRKQAQQAKDPKTRDYCILQASSQALSFEQLQVLLSELLFYAYCAPETLASVHRFALSSVVFPLLREWNEKLIVHLLIQQLILRGVFPEETQDFGNLKIDLAIEIDALLQAVETERIQ